MDSSKGGCMEELIASMGARLNVVHDFILEQSVEHLTGAEGDDAKRSITLLNMTEDRLIKMKKEIADYRALAQKQFLEKKKELAEMKIHAEYVKTNKQIMDIYNKPATPPKKPDEEPGLSLSSTVTTPVHSPSSSTSDFSDSAKSVRFANILAVDRNGDFVVPKPDMSFGRLEANMQAAANEMSDSDSSSLSNPKSDPKTSFIKPKACFTKPSAAKATARVSAARPSAARPSAARPSSAAMPSATRPSAAVKAAAAKYLELAQQSFDRVDEEEFEDLPRYMIGRMKVEEVNDCVDGLNELLSNKYSILSKVHKPLKPAELSLKERYIHQECSETEGMAFLCSEDFNEAGPKFPRGKKLQQYFIILRNCARMREVRYKGLTRYCVCISMVGTLNKRYE